MELPDLNRIIDTYLPLSSAELTAYFNQLRTDMLPHIRKMQTDDQLRWFSYLLHGARHLDGREPEDGRSFIHLRLEPATGLDLDTFIDLLPEHFLKPQRVTLSKISGLESHMLQNDDWAHAWRIHGEASEWVLRLIEGHQKEPSLQQVIQFLHFITNPLMLGHRCLCIPAGFLSF